MVQVNSKSVYQKYVCSGQCMTPFSVAWVDYEYSGMRLAPIYILIHLCNCCVYILQIVNPTSLVSITRNIVSNRSDIKKVTWNRVLQTMCFLLFDFSLCMYFFGGWVPLPIRACSSLATLKKYLSISFLESVQCQFIILDVMKSTFEYVHSFKSYTNVYSYNYKIF